MKTKLLIYLISSITLLSCKKDNFVDKKTFEKNIFQRGVATWYGPGFHGRKSASGEIFNTNQFTAAHRTLKFGTILRVRNSENGKWCVVKINDRGPVSETLLLDLSNAAAVELDMIDKGSAKIEIDILSKEDNFLSKIFDISRNIGKF